LSKKFKIVTSFQAEQGGTDPGVRKFRGGRKMLKAKSKWTKPSTFPRTQVVMHTMELQAFVKFFKTGQKAGAGEER